MLIRITIVAFAIAGSPSSISALIPVEFTDLNIACTGAPRFNEYLLTRGGFCEYLPTCLLNGGRKIGYCTARGICCLVTATCGQTISTIFGYFISDNFPASVSTSGDCEVTIRPFDDRVCQVRLDFEDFRFERPDSTGHCVTDSFEVIGSDFNYPVPVICGVNTGQHMYLNFAEGEIKLRIRATNRNWLIRTTQIRCSNIAALAPPGCLQYFTTNLGTVSSFNFIPGPTRGLGQNLATQDYEVCLVRTSDTCTFTWVTNSSRFDVSSLSIGFANANFEDKRCYNGESDNDFITILGGSRVFTISTQATPVTSRRDLLCGIISSPIDTVTTVSVSTNISERLRVFFDDTARGTGFQFSFNRICT